MARIEPACTVYTRFVDDISLSGDYPQQFISMAIQCVQRQGMRVHKGAKMTVKNRRDPQTVTGYGVNRKTPSKSKARRDRIRAAIHQLRQVNDPKIRAKQILSIRGRIQDISYTNRGAAKRLARQLKRRLPQDPDH